MMTISRAASGHRLGGLLIVAVILLAARCRGPQGPDLKVVSSSAGGDRLTPSVGRPFAPGKGPAGPVIRVDPGIRFQKIDGFGATFNEAGLICLNALAPDAKRAVLEALFDPATGAGYNLMKSPVAACDFASAGPWYSYDDAPGDTSMSRFSIERDLGPNGLVTFIREASRFGKFGLEAPMDFAPDWMYVGLKDGEKHIRPEYYEALAAYYANYLKAYAAQGIVIDYLNLFNEADNSWYSNVTYPTIGLLIKDHVAPRLKAEGLRTKIQFGESANRPEALEKFPGVLGDPDVLKEVSTMTVHGYDWDRFSALTALHEKVPSLPIWQTEVCYARVGNQPTNEPPDRPLPLPVHEFSDGEFWGNMIMNDLKNWVSAWLYWNMILDQNGGPWLVSDEHGDPDDNRQQPVVIVNRDTKEVTYTGLYYYLAHFSKFVKPGAYRIGAAGGSPQLNFAGFENADGGLVLNVINNGDDTDVTISWRDRSTSQRLKAHSIATLMWASIKTPR